MIGLYYLPICTISHDTGLSEQEVTESFTRLQKADLISYDADSDAVFVHDLARDEYGKSLKPTDKQVKGILNTLADYEDCPLIDRFMERYGKDFCLIGEAPSKPLASPFEAPLEALASPIGDSLESEEAPSKGETALKIFAEANSKNKSISKAKAFQSKSNLAAQANDSLEGDNAETRNKESASSEVSLDSFQESAPDIKSGNVIPIAKRKDEPWRKGTYIGEACRSCQGHGHFGNKYRCVCKAGDDYKDLPLYPAANQ
jgi:hypothetical protein